MQAWSREAVMIVCTGPRGGRQELRRIGGYEIGDMQGREEDASKV